MFRGNCSINLAQILIKPEVSLNGKRFINYKKRIHSFLMEVTRVFRKRSSCANNRTYTFTGDNYEKYTNLSQKK